MVNLGDLVTVDFPGATGIKRRPAVVCIGVESCFGISEFYCYASVFCKHCEDWTVVRARLAGCPRLRENSIGSVGHPCGESSRLGTIDK